MDTPLATTPPTTPPPTTWEAPPEEVGPAPGYAYGGFGERLLAYIVDVLIAGALVWILIIVAGVLVAGAVATDSPGAGIGGGLIAVLGILVVSLGYFPWFWARGGQTPGMRLFQLRVVRDRDGGPLSGGQAFLRLIGYWINSIVFYIGFVWIFVDKRKRGWHDLIAGTVVVKKI